MKYQIQETIESRLLHDAERELLGEYGTPPNAAEWAIYYRKEREREENGRT